MTKEDIDMTTITKVTAPPIRTAVFVFSETPRNGQIHKKYDNTKLLIRHAPMNVDHSDDSFIPPTPCWERFASLAACMH